MHASAGSKRHSSVQATRHIGTVRSTDNESTALCLSHSYREAQEKLVVRVSTWMDNNKLSRQVGLHGQSPPSLHRIPVPPQWICATLASVISAHCSLHISITLETKTTAARGRCGFIQFRPKVGWQGDATSTMYKGHIRYYPSISTKSWILSRYFPTQCHTFRHQHHQIYPSHSTASQRSWHSKSFATQAPPPSHPGPAPNLKPQKKHLRTHTALPSHYASSPARSDTPPCHSSCTPSSSPRPHKYTHSRASYALIATKPSTSH